MIKIIYFSLFLFNASFINSQIKVVLSTELNLLEPAELLFYDKGNLIKVDSSILNGGCHYFSVPNQNGFYELTLGELGKIPLVYNGQEEILIEVDTNQLKQYGVCANDIEHKSLKLFQEVYQTYLGSLYDIENNLRNNWNVLGQKEAVNVFLKEYLDIRKEVKLRFLDLNLKFPNTYVSNYISTFYLSPLPDSNENNLSTFFHKNYFQNWLLKNKEVLNNPICLQEIKFYLTFFAVQSGSINEGLDVIMNHLDVISNSEISEILIDILSKELLNMNYNKAEESIVYIYENYSKTCGDFSNLKDSDFNSNIGKRVKSMMVGEYWPEMTFKMLNDIEVNTKEFKFTKEFYTILYFWKSTCDYCLGTAKDFEFWVTSKKDKLNVIAISLDSKKDDLESFLKSLKEIEKRQRPLNWFECWEKDSFASKQIQKIYINSTPTYVILDNNGVIKLRTHDLELVKNWF